MNRVNQIFLDVDGVLADFVGGVCSLYDVNPKDLIDNWPKGVYDVCHLLSGDLADMWGRINARGAGFWANLVPFPHTPEFVESLEVIAPVILFTSPSRDPQCAAGKTEWIQRIFGTSFRSYMIGPPKWVAARPDTVLIDDNDTNCKQFRAHGGQAIVFPQVWNNARQHADRPVSHTLTELHALCSHTLAPYGY